MAWCMHAMWMTHGMHSCMPCGFVQSIKMGSVVEKKRKMRKKGERKKEMKEDLTTSSSESRHSDGRSSSGQELEVAML